MKALATPCLLILITAACSRAPAAPAAAAALPGADAPIDAATRAQLLDLAAERISRHYLFRDVAAKMVADLRARQKRGEYDQATSAVVFADLVSKHLFAIAHDRHLGMRYSPEALPPDPPPGVPPDPAALAAEAASDRFYNNGFNRVERLDGNIGYLKLNHFVSLERAGDTAALAMAFLANCDAFIIDMRENTGGYPQTVDLVESYFLEDGATETAAPAGKRLGTDRRLYVMTGPETISGGEAFAYDLQARKRATIVGETTAGAAHFGPIFRLTDHFQMQIAVGQGVNPITKTNWEGTGVKPDVPVRADLALPTSQLLALEGRADKAPNLDQREELVQSVIDARAELDRLKGGR